MRRDRPAVPEQPGSACGPGSSGSLAPGIHRQTSVPIDQRSAEEQRFGCQPSPSGECRMRWTPPADGIDVPAWKRGAATKAGDVHMQVTTIGLDIAKNVFQVHGADRQRPCGSQEEADALQGARVLRQPAALPRWARGLRRRPLLGTSADPARARGPADGAAVRQALRQDQQARRRRRRGDLRSGAAARHAVRGGQDEHQQSMLMLHRIRDRLVAERTAAINAIRGHMTEFGMVTAQRARGDGRDPIDYRRPGRRASHTAGAGTADACRWSSARASKEKIAELDTRVGRLARGTANCRRLSDDPRGRPDRCHRRARRGR